MLTKTEMGGFAKLFIRGGYVLSFTTADFDIFTMNSIGVPLCNHYGISKGKSLLAFLKDIDPDTATKLLLDLFKYYEFHFSWEYNSEGLDKSDNTVCDEKMRNYYLKCKKVACREHAILHPLQPSVEYILQEFSSDFMNERISLLMSMRESDPTEAIGKSKELIESCCKTILGKLDIDISRKWDLTQLIKTTMSALSITTETITGNSRESEIVRKILGSLSGLASGVAEFRNEYGSGHGKSADFHALPVRHAKLAVGSSITLVEYLWETYDWRLEQGLISPSVDIASYSQVKPDITTSSLAD